VLFRSLTRPTGRAVAQSVSRWFPTAAARVQTPGSSHVGFVVDNVALGQVFSDYFGFPSPIFIPPISPQSPSPIIRGWYNRPVVAAVPKVPPHKLTIFFSRMLNMEVQF
jgi:hypothetical protein